LQPKPQTASGYCYYGWLRFLIRRSGFTTPGFPVLPVTAKLSSCPFSSALRLRIPGRSVIQASATGSRRIQLPFQVMPGRNPYSPDVPVTRSLKERFRFHRLTEHPGLVWDLVPLVQTSAFMVCRPGGLNEPLVFQLSNRLRFHIFQAAFYRSPDRPKIIR